MFNIVKNKKIFFGISIALCLISIVSLIFQGFNLDTDFSGGIALTYEISDDFTTEDIKVLADSALGSSKDASSIQKSGNDVIIKVGYDKGMTDDERAEFSAEIKSQLTSALEEKFGAPEVEAATSDVTEDATDVEEVTDIAEDAADVTEATNEDTGDELTIDEVVATEAPVQNTAKGVLTSGVRLNGLDDISPSSGQELARSAVWMSLLACIGILIYVTIRFEFTSGCVAIVALVHDILILLGIYSIFRISVNINFIAAVLTVLGYSINNTIVIMDRIRENTRNSRKESYSEIANHSIVQTLARSINTTITTLLTIGMVFLLGVTSIKAFALPIILGIVIGFFSSVFISGPLWAVWKDSAVKAKKQSKSK